MTQFYILCLCLGNDFPTADLVIGTLHTASLCLIFQLELTFQLKLTQTRVNKWYLPNSNALTSVY